MRWCNLIEEQRKNTEAVRPLKQIHGLESPNSEREASRGDHAAEFEHQVHTQMQPNDYALIPGSGQRATVVPRVLGDRRSVGDCSGEYSMNSEERSQPKQARVSVVPLEQQPLVPLIPPLIALLEIHQKTSGGPGGGQQGVRGMVPRDLGSPGAAELDQEANCENGKKI